VKRLRLTGKRFGRLLVKRLAYVKNHQTYWFCRCDCGETTIVLNGHLRAGHTTSCGCRKAETGFENVKSMIRWQRKHHYPNSRAAAKQMQKANLKHGHTRKGWKSSEYGTWSQMKQRCLNPKDDKYPDYGGRGITVCARWLDAKHGFENFLADMGKKPSPKKKFSIERSNNDGPYDPSNCVWATASEQMKNRRPFKRRGKVKLGNVADLETD
jgi:hypothetical protein